MKENIFYTLIGASAGFGVGYLLLKKKFQKEVKITQEQDTAITQLHFQSEQYQSIVKEQLIRNIQFFGEDNQLKVKKAFVIVVGVGNIGSHVIAALARSGIEHLRIIDHQKINLSSLNYHAFATREDIGIPKVKCIEKYLMRIVPHIKFEQFNEHLDQSNIQKLLAGDPTYVIDCLNNIDSKLTLISYCRHNKIKVISCGEASMKSDPTQIQIRDISDTKNDDIIRNLRVQLRKNRVSRGVPVIFSVEQTNQTQQQLVGIGQKYKPILGTIPAVIGYTTAAYILCKLADQPFKTRYIDEVKVNTYARMYQSLLERDKKRGVDEHDIQYDLEDIYYIVREIFQWKCLLTGRKHQYLEAVQWDPTKSTNIQNIVLMNYQDTQKHITYDKLQGNYSENIIQKASELLKITGKKQINK